MKTNYILQEELHRILDYDPETGIFTWKIRSAQRVQIGDIAGSLDNYGYLRININGKRYKSHRLAYIYVYGEIPVSLDIDHKNGITNANWIKNLRAVTKSVNQQNKRIGQKNNTSGYLGVSWNKASRKWQAQILIGGKSKYLGRFLLADEAYNAYLDAKRAFHIGCTI